MGIIRNLCAILALSATTTWAGEAWMAFEFPQDWQAKPGLQYIVRYSTLTTPTVRLEEQLLGVGSKAECLQRAIVNAGADTVCGHICLNPGDYAVNVVAALDGERSEESNTWDLDWTNAFPCKPVAVAPPPKTAPDSKTGAAALGVTVAVGATAVAVNAGPAPTLPTLANLACVHWAVEGPCMCNPFTPCVKVGYWQPAYLVETVKKPGTTALEVFKPILDAAFSAVGIPPIGGGGAANASGGGHTNLQYTEAHVYRFPNLLGGPCTGCVPEPPAFLVHYASEIDPLWRTAIAAQTPVSILAQIGVWGPLFPRGGFSIHSSEPVASGIAAVRALSIALGPVDPPPNAAPRVIIPPKADVVSTCCQLAWPRMTHCFPPGIPPAAFEGGSLSLRGTYIWVFWVKKECCLPPGAPLPCGITLPGIGLYGANTCPPIPSP